MGTLIWGVESVCPPVIAEFPPTSCSSTVFRPGLRSEDTPLHPRCRWAPPPLLPRRHWAWGFWNGCWLPRPLRSLISRSGPNRPSQATSPPSPLRASVAPFLSRLAPTASAPLRAAPPPHLPRGSACARSPHSHRHSGAGCSVTVAWAPQTCSRRPFLGAAGAAHD